MNPATKLPEQPGAAMLPEKFQSLAHQFEHARLTRDQLRATVLELERNLAHAEGDRDRLSAEPMEDTAAVQRLAEAKARVEIYTSQLAQRGQQLETATQQMRQQVAVLSRECRKAAIDFAGAVRRELIANVQSQVVDTQAEIERALLLLKSPLEKLAEALDSEAFGIYSEVREPGSDPDRAWSNLLKRWEEFESGVAEVRRASPH